MQVDDRYLRQFPSGRDYDLPAVSATAEELGLRWMHGLIDLNLWERDRTDWLAERRSPGWEPTARDSDVSDRELQACILRACALMQRAEANINYAPRLDVSGFADVLRVSADRVRSALSELAGRAWIEPHAYEKKVHVGNARITAKGWDALDQAEETVSSGGVASFVSVERSTLDYLADQWFRERFATAYGKWVEAHQLLDGDDPAARGSQIGLLCREAMQEFADALVARYRPDGASGAKQDTVARVRAVLDALRPVLGQRKHAFLQALVEYWRTLNGVVQRQTHASERVRTAPQLTATDARRVVFHTAIVMHEIAQTAEETR